MSRSIEIVCLLLPIGAFAADLEFVGGLERITHESILIRLADGARVSAKLPKAGALSAETITAQYKLADEIQITCKPMGQDKCLDLKSLKYLRPPTPKERALVLGTPMASGPPQPELEHARQVNLERAANMPNFVADETAKRYTTRKPGPDEWMLVDTVESEITFNGNYATRQHIRINGKPWNSKSTWLPGINWGSWFGTEIKPVFDPECPTTMNFEGRQEVRGKELLAYRFASPPDGCFGAAVWGGKHHNSARTGRILVEDPGGGVIRYEEEASDFPKQFGVASIKDAVSWDYVRIGEGLYLLPVALDFFVGFGSGDPWHVSVEYKNHRRFEASTNVTFH